MSSSTTFDDIKRLAILIRTESHFKCFQFFVDNQNKSGNLWGFAESAALLTFAQYLWSASGGSSTAVSAVRGLTSLCMTWNLHCWPSTKGRFSGKLSTQGELALKKSLGMYMLVYLDLSVITLASFLQQKVHKHIYKGMLLSVVA